MTKGPSVFTSSFFYLWFKRRGGGGLRPPKIENLRKNHRKMGGGGSENLKLEGNIKNYLRLRWSKLFKIVKMVKKW